MKRLLIISLCSLLRHTAFAQDLSVILVKSDKECEAGKASVSVLSGLEPLRYLWSNGSVDDHIDNLDAGTYTVTVTDVTQSDTSIVFRIEEQVCEPVPEKYFSPNGDGFNDSWDISRIGYFPDFELLVYNRWGQQVHVQTDQYTPWDGKQLGLPLPDATYYYILFFSKSDRHHFVKGDVSILR